MIVAAFIVAASASASPVDAATIQKILKGGEERSTPGCVVGIFRDRAPPNVTAAGLADLTTARPLDGDTLFYAASVSKQFTALAAIILAEQGRLDLDGDIRRYLPELPEYERPVTARMLLLHSSGIRDWLNLARMAGYTDASRMTKGQALALLMRQQSTNFTPGTAYLYSNGGYLLLAEIIERVSGQAFPAFLQDHVFRPLSMRRSFILDGRPPADGNLAHGYVATDKGFERRDTYPLIGGSGGVMTTINDMARFYDDIERGHRVWTPAIRTAMERFGSFTDGAPVIRTPGHQISAAGLATGVRRGQFFVEHSGVAEGFRNQFARIPALKTGLAVFCNRDDRSAVELGDDILLAIAGPVLSSPPFSPMEATFHSAELDIAYTVRIDGEGLHLRIPGATSGAEQSLLLRRLESDEHYAGEGLDIRFTPDAASFLLSADRAYRLRFQRQ